MDYLFSGESQLLWIVLLAAALFFPVRQLIWVVSVRRAERGDGQADEARRAVLKRRANITAVLLGFVFSFFYVTQVFGQPS